jgi:hypothetical protein
MWLTNMKVFEMCYYIGQILKLVICLSMVIMYICICIQCNRNDTNCAAVRESVLVSLKFWLTESHIALFVTGWIILMSMHISILRLIGNPSASVVRSWLKAVHESDLATRTSWRFTKNGASYTSYILKWWLPNIEKNIIFRPTDRNSIKAPASSQSVLSFLFLESRYTFYCYLINSNDLDIKERHV